MSNLYGMFVPPGTSAEEVHKIFEERRLRRESAGNYKLTHKQMAELDKVIEDITARQIDDPPVIEAVWSLPPDHDYAEARNHGLFTTPRCLARVELSGYWEDWYLTEDGRWIHPDAPGFMVPVLPQTIQFSLSVGGPVGYPRHEVEVTEVDADGDPWTQTITAACKKMGLQLRPHSAEEGPAGVHMHCLYVVGPDGKIDYDTGRTHHRAWVSRVRGEVYRGPR